MQIISLLIAGVAITAHSLIPHDHHLNDSISGNSESCPIKKGNVGHHSGFPVHCHAFNDLTSEKVIISFIPDQIKYNDHGMPGLNNSLNVELQIPFTSLNEISEFLPVSFLPELSSLRAPPSVL